VSAADSAEDKKLAAEQRVSLNAGRELEAWMTWPGMWPGMWPDEIESGLEALWTGAAPDGGTVLCSVSAWGKQDCGPCLLNRAPGGLLIDNPSGRCEKCDFTILPARVCLTS
jgi:hypothetical protein